MVTGGIKGAGKAIAERLLQAGATAIITTRNEPEKENSNLYFIPSDLSKAADAQKVVSEVLSTYRRLDILVNNLGSSVTPAGGFAALTDEDWETTQQANLLAPVRLGIGFLPQMIERKRCHYSYRLHSKQTIIIRFYITLYSFKSSIDKLQ